MTVISSSEIVCIPSGTAWASSLSPFRQANSANPSTQDISS
jgi:hypothetical protein